MFRAVPTPLATPHLDASWLIGGALSQKCLLLETEKHLEAQQVIGVIVSLERQPSTNHEPTNCEGNQSMHCFVLYKPRSQPQEFWMLPCQLQAQDKIGNANSSLNRMQGEERAKTTARRLGTRFEQFASERLSVHIWRTLRLMSSTETPAAGGLGVSGLSA
eukprot:6456167-Amphidinium_carterae.2